MALGDYGDDGSYQTSTTPEDDYWARYYANNGGDPSLGPDGQPLVTVAIPWAPGYVPGPNEGFVGIPAPTPAPGPEGGGGGSTNERGSFFSYPEFTPPSWDQPEFTIPTPFSYEDFRGPTAETFVEDPGYEFRSREGRRALENAAASQGALRTGGTLKALIDYGQGLASQEFGNVFNRQAQSWQMNRANAAENYDRELQRRLTDYMVGYNREADEFNRALSVYQTNFGTAATSAGLNLDSENATFGRLLSLYDIATRGLPTYTPTATPGVNLGA